MDDDDVLRRLREMADRFGQELSPSATPPQLAESERLLGHPLPPFLRRVYAEVCNGGIGVGADWRRWWLSGVLGGAGNDWDLNAVDEYLDRRREATGDPGRDWPPGLLPVCHLGCGEFACVDCRTPDGQMVLYRNSDPDVSWFSADSFRPLGRTVREWLPWWLGLSEQDAEPGAAPDPARDIGSGSS